MVVDGMRYKMNKKNKYIIEIVSDPAFTHPQKQTEQVTT